MLASQGVKLHIKKGKECGYCVRYDEYNYLNLQIQRIKYFSAISAENMLPQLEWKRYTDKSKSFILKSFIGFIEKKKRKS